MPPFRSGFVAVVGRPNVGKSTLINYLVGSEVSIISSKPETTRRRISGVIHGDNFQIVLVDTPGVSTIRHALGKKLRQVVNDETEEADAVIFMVDVSQNPVDEDREAASLVRDLKCPKFLVANKVDRLRNKESMIPALHAYGQLMDFKEVYPISAHNGENVDKVLATLVELLPEGVASATSGTSATQQVPWWDSGLTVPGSVLSEVGFRFPDLKPEQTILLRVTAV